ncbi:hypothetical protein AALO_G00006030 [Alosa alosa]|uniref:Uncharacterized protein n=1 Tax=Alosa alosa TaxID=278164 RepID=A0AAV6HIB3_9TELE|nr:hypothetical protein AALO_G00006030 [Alosa alosa]
MQAPRQGDREPNRERNREQAQLPRLGVRETNRVLQKQERLLPTDSGLDQDFNQVEMTGHDYCSVPEAAALDMALHENEKLKREVEDLRKQLDQTKILSRLGLQRFAGSDHTVYGSDEDIHFYTSTDEVVVKLECLLQLFQKCLGCSSKCSISMKREGRIFCMTQKCQQCHYSRMWTSHPPDQLIRDPAGNQEVRNIGFQTSDASNVKPEVHKGYCETRSFLSADEVAVVKIKEEEFEVEVNEAHEDKVRAVEEHREDEGVGDAEMEVQMSPVC